MRSGSVKNLVMIALVSGALSASVSYMSLSIAQLTTSTQPMMDEEYEELLFESYFRKEDSNDENFRTVPTVAGKPSLLADVIGKGITIFGNVLQEFSADTRIKTLVEEAMARLQTPEIDPLTVEDVIRDATNSLTVAFSEKVEPPKEPVVVDYQAILKTLAMLLEQTIPQVEATFAKYELTIPVSAKEATARARTDIVASLTPCKAKEPACALAIADVISSLEDYRNILNGLLSTSPKGNLIRAEVEAFMPKI